MNLTLVLVFAGVACLFTFLAIIIYTINRLRGQEVPYESKGRFYLPDKRVEIVETPFLDLLTFEEALMTLETLKSTDESTKELYSDLLADQNFINTIKGAKDKTERVKLVQDWLKNKLKVPSKEGESQKVHTAVDKKETSKKKTTKKEAASDKEPAKGSDAASANAASPNVNETEINEQVSQLVQALDEKNLENLIKIIEELSSDKIQWLSQRLKSPGQANPLLVRISPLIKNTSTKKEVLSNAKKQFTLSFYDVAESLKRRISSLRKVGVDVSHEDLSLMQVPLKIRVYEATSKKEDLEKIKTLVNTVEIGVKIKEDEYRAKKGDESKPAQTPTAPAQASQAPQVTVATQMPPATPAPTPEPAPQKVTPVPQAQVPEVKKVPPQEVKKPQEPKESDKPKQTLKKPQKPKTKAPKKK